MILFQIGDGHDPVPETALSQDTADEAFALGFASRFQTAISLDIRSCRIEAAYEAEVIGDGPELS